MMHAAFEYDPMKSETNVIKHGIDFDEVQGIWDDFTVRLRVEHKGEQRYLTIGRLAGEYWTVVNTRRGENIRIISARKSTGKERSTYDREANKR